MGWTMADLLALPTDQYDILLDWLSEVFDARASN